MLRFQDSSFRYQASGFFLEPGVYLSLDATVPVATPAGSDSAPTRQIRIAYIILAHHRPEALIRLVRRLYAPDHGFLIHYDLRSSETDYQRIATELGSLPNVTLLK